VEVLIGNGLQAPVAAVVGTSTASVGFGPFDARSEALGCAEEEAEEEEESVAPAVFTGSRDVPQATRPAVTTVATRDVETRTIRQRCLFTNGPSHRMTNLDGAGYQAGAVVPTPATLFDIGIVDSIVDHVVAPHRLHAAVRIAIREQN
jgi:hypothetical protein